MTQSAENTFALDLLLGDFDRKKFFSEYWEEKSLYIPHNDPERFQHLIDKQRFLEHEAYHVRHLKANYKDPRGWSSEMNIQPDQVSKCYEAGMTICATMMREEGAIGDFLNAFRADILSAGGPHFNIYYSPDKKGYGLHFDTHPVWLMQVEGRKHWTVGRAPEIKNPAFNVNFPPGHEVLKLPWATVHRPQIDDPKKFQAVVLNPGDIFYIPPGTWHQALADGYSLALTLAQSRVTAFDILCTAMVQNVAVHQSLFSRVPGIEAASLEGDGLSDELEADLQESLESFKQMIAKMDLPSLRTAYRHLSTIRAQDMQMMDAKKSAELMKPK